ncbi:unnamed protein product [Phaedon cochleariae]|uniref:Uncharacterized protein n=1 Tax=Phaedon cochleariae TaxID=80249 RepID=A0A9N9S964_PHACE|nr:unnamed protein product [Phaedon cochleariae]
MMRNAAVKNQAKVEAKGGKQDNVLDKKLAHTFSSKCRVSTVRRSSSSDSSDVRSRRRREKNSRRSRSRDRYGRTRRSRSKSTSYRSLKSKSHRSDSRDRYRDRHRRSRSKSREKSRDRDRHRSRRSRSKSFIKEFVSKPRRHSSSRSSSSSSEHNKKTSLKNGSKLKQVKTIIESVDNSKTSPDVVILDSKTLDEINEDKFTPKEFTSNKSKRVPDNILIDLKKNTIKVAEVEQVEPDGIFHHNLFMNEEARMEKWVKELYSYRQKALQQGTKNNR